MEGVAVEGNDPTYRVNKGLSIPFSSHHILSYDSVDTRITSGALRYKPRAVGMSGHVTKGQEIEDNEGLKGRGWMDEWCGP